MFDLQQTCFALNKTTLKLPVKIQWNFAGSFLGDPLQKYN